jgi:hypothetical protein
LAFIQILTPAVNILFNAYILRVSPARVLIWVLERPAYEAFQTLLLMPIAGIAIFAMKRWSYPVFLGAVGWSAYRNFRNFAYASGVMPLPMLLLVYAFEIGLVGYFLLPKVRTTYFDPTVRWWESKPRYVLELAARVRAKGGRDLPAAVHNISEGGAFVTASGDLNMDDALELEFAVIGRPFLARGKVVHSRVMDDGRHCFGIQFTHTVDSLTKFQQLTTSLSLLGFQDRGTAEPWQKSLKTWILTLVRTGRGWTPEPEFRKGEKKSA